MALFLIFPEVRLVRSLSQVRKPSDKWLQCLLFESARLAKFQLFMANSQFFWYLTPNRWWLASHFSIKHKTNGFLMLDFPRFSWFYNTNVFLGSFTNYFWWKRPQQIPSKTPWRIVPPSLGAAPTSWLPVCSRSCARAPGRQRPPGGGPLGGPWSWGSQGTNQPLWWKQFGAMGITLFPF